MTAGSDSPLSPPRKLYIGDYVVLEPEYRLETNRRSTGGRINQIRFVDGVTVYDLDGGHLDEHLIAVPDDVVHLAKRHDSHWTIGHRLDDIIDEANYRWWRGEGQLITLGPDHDEAPLETDLGAALELIQLKRSAGPYVPAVGFLSSEAAFIVFEGNPDGGALVNAATFPGDPIFEQKLRDHFVQTWYGQRTL